MTDQGQPSVCQEHNIHDSINLIKVRSYLEYVGINFEDD